MWTKHEIEVGQILVESLRGMQKRIRINGLSKDPRFLSGAELAGHIERRDMLGACLVSHAQDVQKAAHSSRNATLTFTAFGVPCN